MDDLNGQGEDGPACRECGGPMFVDASGTSHHLSEAGSFDDVDHAADRNHAAVAGDAGEEAWA